MESAGAAVTDDNGTRVCFLGVKVLYHKDMGTLLVWAGGPRDNEIHQMHMTRPFACP